jgi:hypothetical protein
MFSLKNIAKDKKVHLNTQLTMCKKKNNHKTAHCQEYEGPILHQDHCHATPAFILSSEKVNQLFIQNEYKESAR